MVQKGTTTGGGKKPERRGSRKQKSPAGCTGGALLYDVPDPQAEGLPSDQRDWKVMGSAIQTGTFLSRFRAGENRNTWATRMAAWSSAA